MGEVGVIPQIHETREDKFEGVVKINAFDWLG
jgi:hypothetical protein